MTEQATRDKIIDRIQKLLRRTEGSANASEAEVEAALEVAQKLMQKYEIEMAELMVKEGKTGYTVDDVVDQTTGGFHSRGTVYRFERLVESICNVICGTKSYMKRGQVAKTIGGKAKWGKNDQIHFYGIGSDVGAAVALWLEIMVVSHALARQHLGKGKWTAQHWYYCDGFGIALWRKAEALAKASKPQTTSACTAIITTKSTAIATYSEGLGLKTTRGANYGRGQATDAYDKGQQDAANFDLEMKNKAKVGSTNDHKKLN